MIAPLVNLARAKSSFRSVKIWTNVFGGAVFLVPVCIALIPPTFSMKTELIVLVGIGAVVGFLSAAGWIAVLAQDLGRSYWLWLLGSVLFGPIGLVVSYIRVRYIATGHGLG